MITVFQVAQKHNYHTHPHGDRMLSYVGNKVKDAYYKIFSSLPPKTKARVYDWKIKVYAYPDDFEPIIINCLRECEKNPFVYSPEAAKPRKTRTRPRSQRGRSGNQIQRKPSRPQRENSNFDFTIDDLGLSSSNMSFERKSNINANTPTGQGYPQQSQSVVQRTDDRPNTNKPIQDNTKRKRILRPRKNYNSGFDGGNDFSY
ncbi:hypothetical protein [Eisenibacter elegans]|jgi:hypothetical protein|uniref:hypothetical protein n=1 Tax=Eisenibacter elegans TaxID=997 RepID=UPI00040775C3|nr:hypothetical protein [Eisenibacter elegans]